MAHRVHKYSAIARPLEPEYRSNLAVMILLSVIALAIGGLAALNGADALGALAAGGEAALVGFLTWALGREADPDRLSGAFIALALAILALAAGMASGLSPAVWTLAFALMAARTVNRTVGPEAKLTDLVLVLVLAGMAIWRDGYAAIGLVAAIAFALDAAFDPYYWYNQSEYGDPRHTQLVAGWHASSVPDQQTAYCSYSNQGNQQMSVG